MLTNDQIKTFNLLLEKDINHEETFELIGESAKRSKYLDKIVRKSISQEESNEFEKEYVEKYTSLFLALVNFDSKEEWEKFYFSNNKTNQEIIDNYYRRLLRVIIYATCSEFSFEDIKGNRFDIDKFFELANDYKEYCLTVVEPLSLEQVKEKDN